MSTRTGRPAPAVEEWTSTQVRDWLAEQGRAIGAATWRQYVRRGQAPAELRHVGPTPVFDAAMVRDWQAGGEAWYGERERERYARTVAERAASRRAAAD